MPVNIRITGIFLKNNYPKNVWDKIEKDLTNWLKRDVKSDLQHDFKEKTKNWSHQPDFPGKLETRQELSMTVEPKGKNLKYYVFVTKGTVSRSIVPRRASGMLIFPRKYTPHTTPSGTSGGPGKRWGEVVHTKLVKRHKIAKRDFEGKIRKKREPQFQQQAAKIVERDTK